MKTTVKGLGIAVIAAMFVFALTVCKEPGQETPPPPSNSIINIAAIQGVTIPVTGGTPVGVISDNSQYSGTVAWNGSPSTFAANTQYIATIILTAKTGYTLQGVAANFFTVNGAASSNAANSGVVTAMFPATGGGNPIDNPIDNPVVGGDPTPVASDFTIRNLTQAVGSVTPVTITPLPGKSNGARTIYYNGSTALPSAEGSYTVTFDVEATEGWRAATGLSAGTLQIVGYQVFASVSALQSYLYETSDTAVFAKLNSLDMTALKSLLIQMNDHKDIYLDISGSTISSIGASAFEGCTSLVSINLPNSVATIGNRAFYGTGLTGVNISNNVSSIGNEAFGSCTSLTEISVGPYNAAYSSQDGVLYNKAGTTLVAYPAGKTDAFTVPNNVTSIESGAFSGYSSPSITIPFVGGQFPVTDTNSHFGYIFGASTWNNQNSYIPASLKTVIITGSSNTYIYVNAFRNCTSLTSVTIGNNVTSIWNGADNFSGCTSLTAINVDSDNQSYSSEQGIWYDKAKTEIIYVPLKITGAVTIPNSVTGIESGGFSGRTGLTSVTIQNSVIGASMFSGCTGLTSITIPSNVTSIGQSAFSGCTSLASVTIQNSVIGAGMFSSCTGLTGITIPDSVTSIGGSAFYGCTGLTSVTIPNSVTSIGLGAFSGCTNLNNITWYYNPALTAANFSSYVKTVIIPDSVTSIGNSAFSSCTGLTSITIPNSVTSIGNNAFSECTGLTSVTIPASVTSIGERAFYQCTSLASVTFQGVITSGNFSTNAFTYLMNTIVMIGELRTKYLDGGTGTYTTTAPVSSSSVWTKQY